MKEKEKTLSDEDTEHVTLCKRGNIDAFEMLVKKHQKRILNIAYRMLGNYEEACEITQDAFVSAYKGIRNFQEKSMFSTWLYSIVVNLSRNRLKQLKIKRYREEFSLDDPVFTDDGQIKVEHTSEESSILEKLEKKEIQQKVQGCIDSLDYEHKEIIVLRDIQGFSYDEMSDMLKVSEGTVKSRLFRARDALKNCLKKVMGNL
ncbi:MAG: hypothetical protein A2Y97_08970 [Nitrospirae bacterium RBG_13_39_12]|nr:MAG: hypothetical protein A2Y97_08970 [Nitrospirae bacterium RBG_13_39_12]